MLQKTYKHEFDYIKLKSQRLTLSLSLKLKLQSDMPLAMKGLTIHMKELNPVSQPLLSQVFQLAQYCLDITALNAVSERSFSVLRRIKTYLRNTMTHNRLNHTMCERVMSERLMQINLKEFLNEFVDASDKRKKRTFAKFHD